MNIKEPFWIAFGGWAARWFAHVWVVKYLKENNLHACEVSGTSMGAIVASFYAFNIPLEEVERVILDTNFLKLVDLDFNTWLISGGKLRERFEAVFGNKKIEDASIPLKIISCNIDNWEKVIFEKWYLVDALRSSVSIPWVVSPYKFEWKSLVDGGIISNLPIEVLKSTDVLAISVVRNIERVIEMKTSFLWMEFNKTFIWVNYQILQKTIDIMMKQNENRSLETPWKNITLIHPVFPKIDYYEFNRFKEICDIGYEEARRVLDS
jgi:predicted acylesterase/phospholipase RssA